MDSLRGTLPSCCACVARPIGNDEEFDPSEAPHLRHAVLGRRAEFAAGRSAAKEALQMLGVRTRTIPAGADRSPIWPSGTIGSITHARGWALAVAASTRDIQGIGIDLEHCASVEPHLWPQVLQTDEMHRLQRMPHADQTRWATATFCAKEAFFKMQWPTTKTWIDFAEVDVVLSASGNRFSLTVRHPLAPPTLVRREFAGIFVRIGHLISALMWI